MHASYYTPYAGRFLSMDPVSRATDRSALSEPRRWNRFTYSIDNPLALVDPTGRDPIPPIIVVGSGVDVEPIIDNIMLVWNYVSPEAKAALPNQSLMAGQQATNIFGSVIRGEASMAYHYMPAGTDYASRTAGALAKAGRTGYAAEVGAIDTAEHVGFWDKAAEIYKSTKAAFAEAGEDYVTFMKGVANATDGAIGEVETAVPELEPLIESIPPE
jgi:hypothetical protein